MSGVKHTFILPSFPCYIIWVASEGPLTAIRAGIGKISHSEVWDMTVYGDMAICIIDTKSQPAMLKYTSI